MPALTPYFSKFTHCTHCAPSQWKAGGYMLPVFFYCLKIFNNGLHSGRFKHALMKYACALSLTLFELCELSPTCRGGGFVRRLVFKFPPFQATLILTGVSTSPLLYRTVKSTTLLFLKIFNAPLTSALSNLPSAVLYSPLCTLFPLKL